MSNSEAQRNLSGEHETQHQYHEAVVFAFKAIVKAEQQPGTPAEEPANLNATIQSQFGFSEIEAQRAIHEATRSWQIAKEDAMLAGIIESLNEDEDV